MCNCITSIKNISKKDFEQLLPIFEQLSEMPIDKIPVEFYQIWDWVRNQYEANINYTASIPSQIEESTRTNLYNFSLAKSISFNQEIKSIRNAKPKNMKGKILEKASIYFQTFQDVENHQVKKVTGLVNQFADSDVKLLEYVAALYNTRETHLKANNVILPSDHPWFQSIGIPLLSEWNCNCTLEEAIDNNITTAPEIDLKKINTPSDIDLEKGKALIFTEDISYFNDVTPIQRRLYKK